MAVKVMVYRVVAILLLRPLIYEHRLNGIVTIAIETYADTNKELS